MVYQLKRTQTNKRPQAFWGSLIPSALSFVGGLITSSQQLDISNQNQLASTLNNYALAQQSYDDKDYNLKYRIGGVKRLGSKNIMITDGGNAKRIGNNTYLLRGGSHEDINETGQTGIGINVGGNEIEAEGGEVAQRKGNSLRIYSAQPILGGISPAEAIMRGYNKDRVFNAQQRFKKNNGIKDDGNKANFGNLITMPFSDTINKVIDYFIGTGKYANKRVKVTPKTVAKKPIKNGQIGNFRVVNGKYFPNEKPLRQVYPEFDIISMGRGLPIKRSLKNIVGFVPKSNTFTRGIGNREGIKDLVESKVVRGNPVGTEITAKAYTKATKSNRNSFNDIMNGTGRKGISHRYYNRSLSKEDFDAIRESYNKINASFKARHPKASGKIRFAIGDDVYDPLGNYKNYDDYLAQIASDRKTLRNATTINPDNGEPIAYFYNDGRNPLTQGHGYASSKWGVRISNPQDYNMKIFDGHLHYSNSKTIPFDSPNVEVFRSTPFGTIRYPKWMLRRGWYRNGGLTSKDKGSSKHPYPSVSSKDFAGGNRGYPIPTKADAIDALRLAALHGRSDVRSKVYNKYPELRKKARGGTKVEPYYDWARNTSSNLRISFIDPTYDYRTYYNSVTPYERNLIRFAPQGTHFTDIGKTPKHPTFSNESIYSNKKYPGGTWNGNVFVPNIWQFGNNGNKVRNKYMNNSGEGYFNGRVNVFPKYRKKADFGTNIGINSYNSNIPDYNSTYINWLISQLPSKQDTLVTKYNQEDINNAINAANIAYQNYLIRQLPSGKSNKQEDNRQSNNRPTRYITADELKRNTQSLVDASIRSVDFANNTYRSKLISQLQPEDKRSLKNKTQSMVDAAQFAVNNAINYRTSKLISQLSNKKDNKQNSKSNNKKETNKVVKRQVRTTPQYTGNTTRGNYRLHDGETKVINGVKYTRRGNTIINHKTNVGYIYDKNGNYTGQADYSKVGNFNQAFDAARAAGRSQFIYRAGKYNNYSTVKETNTKKEALNRRIGARRIAKRMGGLTNPPVERFKCGGRIRPKAEDGMLAPIYSYGTNRRRLPSFAPIDITPRAIPNFKPISVPTNTKTPFDPNSVPFLGRQSTFKPATQDYIGLGIDTLAALGSGMFTRSAYNKMNFDYALPNYVDESPVAFDTTYHNEAQRANIERNRLNARNLIRGNTASAQTSLGRMQQSDVDAMMETNKLLDEKSNKEVELRNQNAANEQQVRARNAAARNQYYQNVAQIKNAALEAKNNAELAKAQSIGADLSGLSQAWTNFAGSIEQRYDNRQKEAIIAATAKDPAVLSNAVQFGYNFSPEVLAAIYNSTDDDNLKSLALSQLSTKNRLRYGIR